MDQEELTLVLRMRDEATKTLAKFEQELRETGTASDGTSKKMKKLNQDFREADKLAERAGNEVSKYGKHIGDLRKQLTGMIGGAAAFYALNRGVRASVGEFMVLEDGMSEIRKTAGFVGADLLEVEQGITDISKRVPLAREALLDLAATAGRAGLDSKEAILEFTETAAQMQVALNGIDPNQLMAFMGNTRESDDVAANIKRVAAMLNMMDDTSKKSAAGILNMATDISAASAMFDISASDILSWSTVLEETGVQSGIASTTFSRLGITIRQSVAQGGEALTSLAGITGMTGEEFKKLANTDMGDAINAVIEGLADLQAKDEATYYQALKQFELDAVQAQKAINPLVAKVDELRKRMSQNEDTDAILDKFNAENAAQLELYSAQLELMSNKFSDLKASLGADFGQMLLPFVQTLGEMAEGFTEWYNSLDDGTQKFVAFSTFAAAGLVSLLLLVGKLGVAWTVLNGIMGAGGAAAAGGTAAKLLLLAGRLTLVGGAIAGVVYGLDYLIDKNKVAKTATDAANESYRTTAEVTEKAAEMTALLGTATGFVTDEQREAAAETRKLITERIRLAQANMKAAASEAALLQTKAAQFKRGIGAADPRFAGQLPGAGAEQAAASARQDAASYAQEVVELQDALAKLDKQINAPLVDPKIPGGNATFTPEGDAKKGGGTSKAQEEIDQRAKAFAEQRAELLKTQDMIRVFTDTSVGNMELMGDEQRAYLDLLEEEQAVVEATWDLRQRKLDENPEMTNAQLEQVRLTELEEKAVRETVRAQQDLDDLRGSTEWVEKLASETDMMLTQVEIMGEISKGSDLEIALLKERLRLRRELTLEEEKAFTENFAAGEALAQAETERDLRRSAAAAQFQLDNAAGTFGDDTESRVQAAIVQAQARRIEQKGELARLSQDEIDAIRMTIVAQDELNALVDEYVSKRDLAAGIFDEIADGVRDFVLEGDNAQDVLANMLKGLADLVWQYGVLIPLQREFMQMFSQGQSGGGGFGGFLSGLVGAVIGGGGSTPSATTPIVNDSFFANTSFFKDGGIMTEWGKVPLRKYSGGGIANSPQLAMFGEGSTPEAFVPVPSGKIPVEIRGGGGNSITVHSKIEMNFSGNEANEPEELARMVSDVSKKATLEALDEQLRPGGMIYESQKGR